MQSKVYPFPSPDELNMIQMVVQAFLSKQTAIARRLMLRTIHKTLERYKVSRLNFLDFTVEPSRGKCAVIYARHFIQGRVCPNCLEPIYPENSGVRVISIKEEPRQHTVTYGCRCGAIFGKKELV